MQTKAPKDYGLIPGHMTMDYKTETNLTGNIPFTLKAGDFIIFAESDLKGKSKRDLVNALNNIKRAIENRIDCILLVFKYSNLAKNWNFPDKIEKLNKLGIIAPRILRKINRIRHF